MDRKGMGLDTVQSILKELVSGFIHDVKNPLTSIRGALRILTEKIAEDDPNRKIIQQINEQVARINQSLSDLMDFTQIPWPVASPTDIAMVVKEVLRRVESDCQRRKICVKKQLSAGIPEINVDAKQIEFALLHLFSDMLKTMPNGGTLFARARLDPDGCVLLEIEDTGASIPEIQMERLFKPFLSTRGRGAGTGLSIVKRIIDQNGGSIQAKNRGEEGLIFRILFPNQFRRTP
jgi:signal transduction histidine kinase